MGIKTILAEAFQNAMQAAITNAYRLIITEVYILENIFSKQTDDSLPQKRSKQIGPAPQHVSSAPELRPHKAEICLQNKTCSTFLR